MHYSAFSKSLFINYVLILLDTFIPYILMSKETCCQLGIFITLDPFLGCQFYISLSPHGWPRLTPIFNIAESSWKFSFPDGRALESLKHLYLSSCVE